MSETVQSVIDTAKEYTKAALGKNDADPQPQTKSEGSQDNDSSGATILSEIADTVKSSVAGETTMHNAADTLIPDDIKKELPQGPIDVPTDDYDPSVPKDPSLVRKE
ncbi:hypothetical protein CANCADRAFT_42268 [Tortispora caseinolytica NRRL Y-17796]|uniref:Uncharacterized protein n=1 Tax=Tortispora caseinolytica NRRL Y-17796 TaxID=767744 RepID=A0A1E4TIQ5_9ASCO|nr:hypothetical protein CANCADRAFT_42268 [Tortispora caseinolytica NRRL Y-17796]